MRIPVSVLALALAAVSGCTDGRSPAGPDGTESIEQVLAAASPAAVEMAAAAAPTVGALGSLPADLALTREQRATIRALFEAHGAALHADRLALRAIHDEAAAARAANATPAEIAAILLKAAPIQARIAAANEALLTQVLAVLTPAQRAWVEAHAPKRCDRARVALTDSQRQAVEQLHRAFVAANQADLAAIAAVMTEARAAHAAGKTRAEIQAILAKAAPAMERVAAARAELQAKIDALLTDAQKPC